MPVGLPARAAQLRFGPRAPLSGVGFLPCAQAEMREPLKSLVALPVDVQGLAARLPQALQPPGL